MEFLFIFNRVFKKRIKGLYSILFLLWGLFWLFSSLCLFSLFLRNFFISCFGFFFWCFFLSWFFTFFLFVPENTRKDLDIAQKYDIPSRLCVIYGWIYLFKSHWRSDFLENWDILWGWWAYLRKCLDRVESESHFY